MSEKKSGLDKIFDIAEGALDTLGGALTPAPTPAPQKQARPDFIDAESSEVRHAEWEKSWDQQHYWAMAGASGSTGEAFHVFKEGSLRALGCHQNFRSDEIRDRRPHLEHGKRIVACTSCIIWVSQK